MLYSVYYCDVQNCVTCIEFISGAHVTSGFYLDDLVPFRDHRMHLKLGSTLFKSLSLFSLLATDWLPLHMP